MKGWWGPQNTQTSFWNSQQNNKGMVGIRGLQTLRLLFGIQQNNGGMVGIRGLAGETPAPPFSAALGS